MVGCVGWGRGGGSGDGGVCVGGGGAGWGGQGGGEDYPGNRLLLWSVIATVRVCHAMETNCYCRVSHRMG